MSYRGGGGKVQKYLLCQIRWHLHKIPWFILGRKVRRFQRHASGDVRQRKICICSYPLISEQPTFALVSYSIY